MNRFWRCLASVVTGQRGRLLRLSVLILFHWWRDVKHVKLPCWTETLAVLTDSSPPLKKQTLILWLTSRCWTLWKLIFSTEPASLRLSLHDKWNSSAYGLYLGFLWSCRECDSLGGDGSGMKDYRQFISLVGGNLRYIRNEIFVLYKVRFHRVHTTVWIHNISCVLAQLCMFVSIRVSKLLMGKACTNSASACQECSPSSVT